MPENLYTTGDLLGATYQEKDALFLRTIELERELMRVRRTEKVLHEMEQRYLALMDSSVFLHIILTPDGTFRMMNHCAEEYLGFQLRSGIEVTLQKLAGPGHASEIDRMLKETMKHPTHVTMPIERQDHSIGWLDAEFSYSVYHGELSLQLIAADISDFMNTVPSKAENSMADGILASCPGLLCFAVDRSSALLYASRGYCEMAKRFLGHPCVIGDHYPPAIATQFEMELQELMQEAFNGDTNLTELSVQSEDGANSWHVMVSPLVCGGSISGAAVNLITGALGEQASDELSLSSEDIGVLHSYVEKAESSRLDLFNAVKKPALITDNYGRCLEVNRCFLKTLKLTREEVIGQLFADLAKDGEHLNANLAGRIEHAILEDQDDPIECKVSTKDGEVIFLSAEVASTPWGDSTAAVITLTDNTRLRRTEEQLKRMSTTDSATGVLNRQGIERVLHSELERATRYKGSLSLVMFDVDGFRGLNERIGYAASDKVLRSLTSALKNRLRSMDSLGRWGGDEFIILMPSPAAAACLQAEKLRDMTEHNTFGDGVVLTLSAGVAELRKGMEAGDLVAAAFDSLTEAKRSGGNRVIQADQGPNEADSQQEDD